MVIIIVLIMILPSQSNSTTENETSVSAESEVAKPTPAPTEEPSVLELVGGIEGTEGVWDGYSIHITGKVKINSDRDLSFVQVRFSLYDEQGNMIGSALDNEFNVDANGVWSFDAIGISKTPVDSYKCSELEYHY